MTEIKQSDFKHNDRVELSEYFDVYAHGNGFQLKREDKYYSIIPVADEYKLKGVEEIGWEVNSDENRFDDLHSAIQYILEQEGVSVKVHSVKEFYGMKGDKQ